VYPIGGAPSIVNSCNRHRSNRLAAAAAIFALLLIAPLRDALACAAARACAAAPCCAAKSGGCPMHAGSSRDSCRLRSCGQHEVSLAETPPIVISTIATLQHSEPPAFRLFARAVATNVDFVAPPDSPPPRHLG